MDRWIPVSKKAPAGGDLVLACDMNSDTLSKSYRVTWRAGEHWYTGYESGPIEAPTYWMPLPSAPERQENE